MRTQLSGPNVPYVFARLLALIVSFVDLHVWNTPLTLRDPCVQLPPRNLAI